MRSASGPGGGVARPDRRVFHCRAGVTIRRVQVRLLAFASAVEAVGAPSLDWQLPRELTVSDLRRQLVGDFPAIAPLLARLAIAVDGTLATAETLVREGAEVALLPPVSGG